MIGDSEMQQKIDNYKGWKEPTIKEPEPRLFIKKRTIDALEGKNKDIPPNIINGSIAIIALQPKQITKEPIIWGSEELVEITITRKENRGNKS